MRLCIAKEKHVFGNPESIQNKITYEEWRKGIAHYEGQFTWLDDTSDAPYFYKISPGLKPYVMAYFDFDRKKGYHQTRVVYTEIYGSISLEPAKITISKLIFFKKMAECFEGTYLIANGQWIVDDAFIEKHKEKAAQRKQARARRV